MKKRLKEMEEEAILLRDMQTKVEKEMSAAQGKYIYVRKYKYRKSLLEILVLKIELLQVERRRMLDRFFVGNVTAKRTNVPGIKGFRGPYIPGYRPRRPYGYVLYDTGKIPRFRRPMRYRPYY